MTDQPKRRTAAERAYERLTVLTLKDLDALCADMARDDKRLAELLHAGLDEALMMYSPRGREE